MSSSFTPSGIPTAYYNLFADLGLALDPPLDPATGQPMGPEKLAQIFPMGVLEQEMTQARYVPIPAPVLDAYAQYRPTPLRRASRLEEAIGTKCALYFKYEGASPVGSHKLNTAIAQAYLNAKEGVKKLATETGAGQWGTALSFAATRFGLECVVYMVRSSYEQKPFRRVVMELFGAQVTPSPSEKTASGKAILAANPTHPGSLGVAISEAVEHAVTHPGTKYALGSVLNHVLLHQTVIGLEAERQLGELGVFPDAIVACHGGGSNFGGIAFPFLKHKADGKALQVVAAEPSSCPTLTKGKYEYDFGDTAKLTPKLKMHTLGADFIPDPIHAGGLRYHGAAPLVSRLLHEGLIEARAYEQRATFDAAREFARAEGIIPAPESAHAIVGAIQLAREADKAGKKRNILFNVSGHGLFDLGAYQAYLAGKI